MNKLKFYFVFWTLCLLSTSGFSQEDCASLQCDCANLADTSDAGAIALCKYYEKAMKEACAEVGGNLKCHKTHKGPNANAQLEGLGENVVANKPVSVTKETNNVPTKKVKPEVVVLPKVAKISDIKYCNQLMTYLKQEGHQFGNIRVPANARLYSYFKEAWAYDYNGTIYVIVIASKEKKETGYDYKLAVQYENYEDYQYFVFCDITTSAWRKFSDACNDCDYDDRYTKYIRNRPCDCL